MDLPSRELLSADDAALDKEIARQTLRLMLGATFDTRPLTILKAERDRRKNQA